MISNIHDNRERDFVPMEDMAWNSSVRPRDITFKHTVPIEIVRVIISALSRVFPELKNKKEKILTSLKPVTDPSGHFCLSLGRNRWFLRISRRRRKNVDIEDIVTFFLNNSGINVNLPFISNFEILWDGHSYLLYLFPIVEGRHYNGSDEDLKNVSRVVARMHKVLRSFKFNNIVFANALKTADRLAAVKEMLVRHLDKDDFSIFYERSDWTKRNHLWLRNMARNFNPYLCKKTGSQCIHGELHLGNVIFSLKDGGVILTDFEETVDSWLPPSFDLAYLVHRFCMDGIDSKLIFQKKLKILKKYYGKLPSNLEEISHQVCWYNVTLLIDKSVRRKSIVSEEEYDKFMNLEDKTTFLFS